MGLLRDYEPSDGTFSSTTDHSPPCHYIPGDGATLGPAPPHAEELGGLIPQFYAGLRCGVGRGPTRDSGLGNLGIAAAALPAGCG